MVHIGTLCLVMFGSVILTSCKEPVTQHVSPPVVNARNITNLPLKAEEYFVDSISIGQKKINKIELFRYRCPDSVYADIHFYTRDQDEWLLKQSMHFLKDGILWCDPELVDINNDGFYDLTAVSAIAGRGANQVRRVFIYDKGSDKMIEMKNAERYPNLRYNSELDCIDALLVYAGTTTAFLKIDGDSLREFASVTAYEGLTEKEVDNLGHETVIYNDPEYEASYVRFRNYKPLKECNPDEY